MALTERQEKFAAFFVQTGNATKSYRAAGYEPKTDASAQNAASRLLGDVGVRGRVEELRAAQQARTETTSDWVKRRLREEADFTGEGSSHSARVSALTTLARTEGLLIDRKRVERGVTVEVVQVVVRSRAEAKELLPALAEANRVP